MPNGHQEDYKPLWEQVKDMQESYDQEREATSKLRSKVRKLEDIIEAFKITISALEE